MVNKLCCFSRPSSLLLLFVASFPLATSLSFSFNFTGSDGVRIARGLNFSGNAAPTADGLKLASNITGKSATNSVGRVLYPDRLRLWDSTSGNITTFTTHFSFIISNSTVSGADGLAFFLAPPSEQSIPSHSTGGNLGLFNDSANRVVAAEFDTYPNAFDPRSDHIGIDVYSIKSIASVQLLNVSMSNGSNTAHATVKYDGGAMNLSVLLSYTSEDPSVDGRSWKVSRVVDLREYLPEKVAVGFSASTGLSVEAHTILSWDFKSTELPVAGSPPASASIAGPPPAPVLASRTVGRYNKGRRLLLGILIGVGIILS